jgi:hypothetical protein
MPKSCFAPIKLCALRVSRLTAGGAPEAGALNGYVTSAIQQAQIGIETEDGDSFTIKDGCGNIAHTLTDPDKITNATIGMTLTNFDFELYSILIGNSDLFLDTGGAGSGDPVGWQMPAIADGPGNGVCLELWSRTRDGGAYATPDFAGGSAVYYHWVFPLVQFAIDEFTLENGVTTPGVSGVSSENPNLTVNGPYNDFNADVAAAGGITAVFGVFFDTNIPDSVCGRIEVPAGS